MSKSERAEFLQLIDGWRTREELARKEAAAQILQADLCHAHFMELQMVLDRMDERGVKAEGG